MNISVYASDALAMALPLASVGGGEPIHDWNYMLFEFGLLRWTSFIGNAIYAAGVVTIILSVAAGLYLSFRLGEDKPITG